MIKQSVIVPMGVFRPDVKQNQTLLALNLTSCFNLPQYFVISSPTTLSTSQHFFTWELYQNSALKSTEQNILVQECTVDLRTDRMEQFPGICTPLHHRDNSEQYFGLRNAPYPETSPSWIKPAIYEQQQRFIIVRFMMPKSSSFYGLSVHAPLDLCGL